MPSSQSDSPRPSFSDKITRFVDDNLRLIRTSSVILPCLGVALLAHNYGLFTRYNSWSEAARKKGFTAFVGHVQSEGNAVHLYLYSSTVFHRAFFRTPSVLSPSQTLRATLAMVQPVDSFAARDITKQLLFGRTARIVCANQTASSIQSTSAIEPVFVYRGIGGFQWDVGESLIRRGAAVVVKSPNDLHPSPAVVARYCRAQEWAKFRGRGVWAGSGSMIQIQSLWRLISSWLVRHR
uniref:Uncharacterized protein n=1 Tax=Spongospora subterranea TaxID=70186 RepID=A0A0H5R9G7_9EUKA|eukprot:CRZ10770.1 hypothetical protein [Spongospora subterranea]